MFFILLGVFSLFFPKQVCAHGVGQVYTLPIPLKYYLGSAGLAVALSFFIFALINKKPQIHAEREFAKGWLPGTLHVLRALALIILILGIFGGLLGTNSASRNIVPIFFWIVFILGFSILSIIVSNIWDKLNPWKTLTELFGIKPGGRRISGWAGVILVFVLYWFELSSGWSFFPSAIAIFLFGYVLVNLIGAYFFTNWFEDAELFSVLFSFIGRLAYFKISKDNKSFISLRLSRRLSYEASWQLVGLAMILLAGTSFDSFKETTLWFQILDFFKVIYSVGLIKLADSLGLIFSPLPFIFLYFVVIWVMARLTGLQFLQLSKKFTFSLIPIGFGYTLAHNFSLVIVNIPIFLGLLSDPFGFGWNIFGTIHLVFSSLILGAKYIWFIEIGFIVLAHIVGTFFAHLIAIQMMPDQKKVLVSQIPAMILMVGFTTLTLWLLSQPLVVFR